MQTVSVHLARLPRIRFHIVNLNSFHLARPPRNRFDIVDLNCFHLARPPRNRFDNIPLNAPGRPWAATKAQPYFNCAECHSMQTVSVQLARLPRIRFNIVNLNSFQLARLPMNRFNIVNLNSFQLARLPMKHNLKSFQQAKHLNSNQSTTML